jgi:hypothetical protein
LLACAGQRNGYKTEGSYNKQEERNVWVIQMKYSDISLIYPSVSIVTTYY